MKGGLGVAILLLIAVAVMLASCGGNGGDALTRYEIDADTQGVIEEVDNIFNTSIVSNDPNVFKAEYEAGFIQGRLQKDQLIPARDNAWDSAYLLDPSHSYPKQIPPSADERPWRNGPSRPTGTTR